MSAEKQRPTRPEDTRTPLIKFAETTESVYITIEVSDCAKPELKIDEDSVSFDCTTPKGRYWCYLQLKADIKPEDENTKWVKTDLNVQVHVTKKEAERWNQLLKDRKLQKNFVKPDFDLWVDSDDEEKDAGGFDMGQFGAGGGGGMPPGMGGMGGMGGGMPGMPGMGGMGGMGGGMPGMPGMGGMGGMPGMEGMDMSKMMEMMKGMKGMGGGAEGDVPDEDDEDDDLPDLENAEDEEKA